VNRELLVESDHRSFCPWKGEAGYYTIAANGGRSEDSAWYYRKPSRAARKIKNRVAFWHDVEVVP
jgi:uncharacterized protein (DUF427 family)